MLEPSNLGQILGRLMYADDRLPGRRKPQVQRNMRKDQVLDLIRERGVVACRDLVAAIGITSDYSAVILNQLHHAGKLVRTGTRCRYRYSLA